MSARCSSVKGVEKPVLFESEAAAICIRAIGCPKVCLWSSDKGPLPRGGDVEVDCPGDRFAPGAALYGGAEAVLAVPLLPFSSHIVTIPAAFMSSEVGM